MFYERGSRVPTVDTLARIIVSCGMELRLEVVTLADADLASGRNDREVGVQRAHKDAERFGHSIRSVHPLRST